MRTFGLCFVIVALALAGFYGYAHWQQRNALPPLNLLEQKGATVINALQIYYQQQGARVSSLDQLFAQDLLLDTVQPSEAAYFIEKLTPWQLVWLLFFETGHVRPALMLADVNQAVLERLRPGQREAKPPAITAYPYTADFSQNISLADIRVVYNKDGNDQSYSSQDYLRTHGRRPASLQHFTNAATAYLSLNGALSHADDSAYVSTDTVAGLNRQPEGREEASHIQFYQGNTPIPNPYGKAALPRRLLESPLAAPDIQTRTSGLQPDFVVLNQDDRMLVAQSPFALPYADPRAIGGAYIILLPIE